MTDQNTDEQFTVDSAPKKNFLDGVRRPNGKWMIFMLAMLLFAIVATAITFLNTGLNNNNSIGDASKVHVPVKKSDTEIGGKATPEYNSQMLTHTTEKANDAASTGASYIPPPTTNMDAVDKALKVIPVAQRNEPINQQQAVNDQQQAQVLKQAMKVSLEMVTKGMELQPQDTQSFIKADLNDTRDKSEYSAKNTPAIANTSVNGSTVHGETIKLPGGIHSGSILYATNDIKLNSDGKNPVIRATVTNGPLKNYVALGTFSDGGESLALTFSRIVSPDGQEYKVEAYGIDPSIPEANIASDVDHHYLSRWGSFSASAFLTGFANATQMAGTSNIGSGVVSGTAGSLISSGVTSVPVYSLMSKGIIGMGQVGTQIGNELRKDVNRPATVTLDPGVALGILIVTVGNSQGSPQSAGAQQPQATASAGAGFQQASQENSYQQPQSNMTRQY